MPKFIRFGPTVRGDGYEVISQHQGCVLGTIGWYPAWQQWVFEAAAETIWSEDCLSDVCQFMRQLPKKAPADFKAVPTGGKP